MSLPGSVGFGSSTIATIPATGRTSTMSFSEDPTTKIRKPFPIKKSRENWTEQEHDRFLEALHLFNRDWKKIEAFVGSKTVVQIRSHAQNYFLKVQKSGANEHLSLSRPKRKASHPCPQKAPKNVAFTSQVIGNLPSSSTPLLEPSYLYSSDPQPLLGNQAACASSSSSWKHESINLPKPILEEEPGVSATALPRNHCYSTVSKEDTRKLLTVTKPNDEESCEKPHRAMPNFAEVVQIRSHAQKYFLKFQKSGANEHLPPPRPKRKASHPCPQKAPKNVAFTSHVIGNLPSSSTPLPEPGYLYSSDPQPLLGNQAACASSSSSWNHESTNLPKPVLEEEPGVSATALPRNHCWSNLPLDLMQLVFKRLGFADFQRAKSVCSSWQSGSRLSQPNNQIPWMISFPRDQNYCLLFNPEEKEKVYKTRDFDDDFAKSFCVATHRSWLLMLDPKYGDWCKGNNENPDYNLYILHLFTGERINLPTLETELGFTPDPVFWIDEKTKDYYLVIKMINREYTVSLTKGDNSWKQIPQSSLSDMDHKLYCPSDYKLKVFYLFGGMPPLVFGISGCIQRAPSPYCRRLPDIPMPNEMSQSRKKVVVTLSGDILIVNSFRPVFSRIWKFRVYKLKGNKWEEINSLGDEAILLDLGITVLAKDLHGVQKNSIYFTGPHFQYPCVENDIFLFNLNTNKIEKPHQFVSSSIPFYSCWFLPSFKP